MRNVILLLIGVSLVAGCAGDYRRNPLYGRQDEFDRRLAESDRSPTWAYQNCKAYQRQYFQVLAEARAGEIPLIDLTAFEWSYDQELKIVEKP
jgi:hypothetical protein